MRLKKDATRTSSYNHQWTTLMKSMLIQRRRLLCRLKMVRSDLQAQLNGNGFSQEDWVKMMRYSLLFSQLSKMSPWRSMMMTLVKFLKIKFLRMRDFCQLLIWDIKLKLAYLTLNWLSLSKRKSFLANQLSLLLQILKHQIPIHGQQLRKNLHPNKSLISRSKLKHWCK